jgi:hypothetical protein
MVGVSRGRQVNEVVEMSMMARRVLQPLRARARWNEGSSMEQPESECAVSEDEGRSVGTRLRRPPTSRGVAERLWSRLWIYNEPSWSLRQVAVLAMSALVMPFVALLAGPLLLITLPLALFGLALVMTLMWTRAMRGSTVAAAGPRSPPATHTSPPLTTLGKAVA